MKKKASRWLGTAIALAILTGFIPTYAFAMEEKDEKAYFKVLPKELWSFIFNKLSTEVWGKILLLSKDSQLYLKETRKTLAFEERKMPQNPSFLQGFSSLTWLSITGSRISIPVGIAFRSPLHFLNSLRLLTNLRTFGLSSLQRTIFEPINLFSSLKELTRLEHLSLNFFEGDGGESKIPPHLLPNLKLKTFYFAENKIRSLIFLSSGLEFLDLSSSFREEHWEHIGDQKATREAASLHLCKQLPLCTALKELDFGDNKVGLNEAREIAKLTSLVKLNLENAGITSEAMAELGKLSASSTLTYLNLLKNPIGPNIQVFSGFTQLQHLSLELSNPITDQTINHLSSFLPSMTRLRGLSLGELGQIYIPFNSLILVRSLTSLTNLASLCLPGLDFDEEPAKDLERFLSHLSNLKEFTMEGSHILLSSETQKKLRVIDPPRTNYWTSSLN